MVCKVKDGEVKVLADVSKIYTVNDKYPIKGNIELTSSDILHGSLELYGIIEELKSRIVSLENKLV
jgi:hypothetical protein